MVGAIQVAHMGVAMALAAVTAATTRGDINNVNGLASVLSRRERKAAGYFESSESIRSRQQSDITAA